MVSILYVARSLNLVDGGGSNYSLNVIADSISERGFDVEVHVTDEVLLKTDPQYTVVDLTDEFAGRNYLSLGRRLYSHLKSVSSEYDLVHVFNPSYLSIAGIVRTKTTTPMVGRLNTYTPFCTNLGRMNGECHQNCGLSEKITHDDRPHKQKILRGPRYALQNKLEPKYVGRLDRLFAISPTVKEVYTEYGYSENRIVVIPNTVEGQNREPNPANRLADDQLSVLYVGRLESQKGLSYLIDALAGITKHNIVVNIVGAGNQRDKLQSRSEKTPENIDITFHGYVDHEQLPEYYGRADLLAHPHTWPEPYGRVIIEALQHNCPVLCSDIGAPKWIAGKASEAVAPRDVQELRTKLTRFADEPKRIENLRQHCTQEIERFEKDPIVDRVESEYGQLIQRDTDIR